VYHFETLDVLRESEYRRHFDVNVLGPLLATQEAAPLLAVRGGSVINVGTVLVENPMAGSAVYAASKAALHTITQVLAKELGPRGIRVNTLHPGAVETEGAHAAGLVGAEWLQPLLATTPLGARMAQPDDIAKVALFFASDDASWVTGESLVVSGGYR
jgi:3-oxoacyl-[acyl-carrier protein] reductase